MYSLYTSHDVMKDKLWLNSINYIDKQILSQVHVRLDKKKVKTVLHVHVYIYIIMNLKHLKEKMNQASQEDMETHVHVPLAGMLYNTVRDVK